MPLTADRLANTWQRLPKDARETVTFYSKAVATLPTSGQSVPNTHRLPLDAEVAAGNERLARFGIVWDIWASQMTEVEWGTSLHEPKFGDVFYDASGIGFHIESVQYLDMRQRYRLTCIQLQNKVAS